ncbi:hypothetical protein M422DRAFT_245688 [Sphaerobolus stellatus SS14]|nr:hypothetical protein M422DRAFT_245688 [Sphaerobolus stellatus SS14]
MMDGEGPLNGPGWSPGLGPMPAYPPPHGPPPGPQAMGIQGLKTAVNYSQINSYSVAISATIFFYDYLLILPSEIKYLRPTNRGLGNFLYAMIRVLGFIDVGYLRTSSMISQPTCAVLVKLAISANTVGIFLSELTLSIRVWATWNYNRLAGLILLIGLVGGGVPSYTFLAPILKATLCESSGNDHF